MSPASRSARGIVLAAALTSAAAFGQREVLDPGAFTQQYCDSVHRMDAAAQTKIVDQLAVRVTLDGRTRVSALDSAYASYAQAPETLDHVLTVYARAALALFSDDPLARPKLDRLVAVVKGRDFVQNTGPEGGDDKAPALFVAPLNRELVMLYAVDGPLSVGYVDKERLAALPIHGEELRARAILNTRRAAGAPSITEDEGLFLVTANGVYGASLLLVDDFWTRERFNVKGDIVVGVPNRDTLVVTGSREEALSEVRQFVRDTAAESAYPVSDKLFVRRDNRWAVFSE